MLLVSFANVLCGFIGFLSFVLTIRLYLTWFPNLNMYGQPFYTIVKLTDPYLKLYRGAIPIIFGVDLSMVVSLGVLNGIEYGLQAFIRINS
jgi:YggT family protein